MRSKIVLLVTVILIISLTVVVLANGKSNNYSGLETLSYDDFKV